jgi:caa(3)-type oxidase subunit IV
MAEGKKKGAGDKPDQKTEKKADAAKAKDAGAEKKAEAKPKEAVAEKKAEKKAEAKPKEAGHDGAEKKSHAEEEIDQPAHPHGAGHKGDLREVFTIFVVLAVLTALEVGVASVPGISHVLKGFVLVALAVTKAACVGLYYMHLKNETKILKLTVAIPMATPAFYALVLISEAAWRLTRW